MIIRGLESNIEESLIRKNVNINNLVVILSEANRKTSLSFREKRRNT